MTSRTLTATLAGLAMVGAFAVDTFLPSFPAIAADFSIPTAVVQQTLSAYLLAFSIMSLLYGTLSDAFGWRSVFLFLAFLGLALLAVTWRHVPESLPAARRVAFSPSRLAGRYMDALRNRRFVAGALAVGCAFGGQAIYISAAPRFVMHILHLPETAFAWLFVPMIGGLVGGAATGSRLASRTAPRALLRVGFTCMGAGAGANVSYNMACAAALPWAVLPIMLYAFGLGLAMPVMTIATLDLIPDMRGLAASLITFTQMLVFSLMSGVVAPLAFGSAAGLAGVVACCCVLAYACWRIASR